MITLHQLKVFVAVAECGGTAAASRKLHLSQPSVSLIIRTLESELGAELFIRNPPKGLAITPFGRSKLEEARGLLNSAKMFGEPLGKGSQIRGQITIGYFTTLGPSYVPQLVRKLKDSLPKVEINLQEGDLSTINRMLDTGQIELALTYDLGLSDRPRIHLLQECQFYAALPTDHALTDREAVSLEEIAAENYVQIDLPYSREFLMSPFWHYNLEPNITHKATSLEMVRGMVANGLGVSLLITRPASDITYDGGRIVCRPISDALPSQKLVLAQSNHISPTPIASAVKEAIVDLLERHCHINENEL